VSPFHHFFIALIGDSPNIALVNLEIYRSMQTTFKTGLQVVGVFFASWSLLTQPVFGADEPPAPMPPATNASPWNAVITAGLTLSRGNSDTTDGTLSADANYKKGLNELMLGVSLTYGEANGVKNNELYRGYADYHRLFTEKFYGSLRFDGLHDGVAGINYRFVLAPSVGYYFIKDTKGFLRGEVGPGYVVEQRESLTDVTIRGQTFSVTETEDNDYATLRLAERGEYQLSKNARAWESVEALPQVDRFNNVIINAEIGIDVAINARWSLRTILRDTYDNEPPAGRLKNDLMLITGLSFRLK